MDSFRRQGEQDLVGAAFLSFAKVTGVGLATLAAVTLMAAIAHGRPAAVAAGARPISTCTDRATVSFSTSYSAALPGIVVTRIPIRAGQNCAHSRYELRVSDADRHRVVTRGILDAKGAATAAMTGETIDAATVTVGLIIVS
jgi:hypothetical protein